MSALPKADVSGMPLAQAVARARHPELFDPEPATVTRLPYSAQAHVAALKRHARMDGAIADLTLDREGVDMADLDRYAEGSGDTLMPPRPGLWALLADNECRHGNVPAKPGPDCQREGCFK